jgi:hypothetical protein
MGIVTPGTCPDFDVAFPRVAAADGGYCSCKRLCILSWLNMLGLQQCSIPKVGLRVSVLEVVTA